MGIVGYRCPEESSPGQWCFLGSESFHGFPILLGGFPDDLLRQRRCGGRLVPVEGFQVVAQELLVEAGLGASRAVVVLWPEAAGIGGEAFIDDNQLPVADAEFELRVGDDDAAACGNLPCLAVDVNGCLAGLFRNVLPAQFHHLFKGDVFVVVAELRLWLMV